MVGAMVRAAFLFADFSITRIFISSCALAKNTLPDFSSGCV